MITKTKLITFYCLPSYTHFHTCTQTLPYPKVLIEHRVDCVGLDAGLPLALARLVWEEVGLHIAANGKDIQPHSIGRPVCRDPYDHPKASLRLL